MFFAKKKALRPSVLSFLNRPSSRLFMTQYQRLNSLSGFYQIRYRSSLQHVLGKRGKMKTYPVIDILYRRTCVNLCSCCPYFSKDFPRPIVSITRIAVVKATLYLKMPKKFFPICYIFIRFCKEFDKKICPKIYWMWVLCKPMLWKPHFPQICKWKSTRTFHTYWAILVNSVQRSASRAIVRLWVSWISAQGRPRFENVSPLQMKQVCKISVLRSDVGH